MTISTHKPITYGYLTQRHLAHKHITHEHHDISSSYCRTHHKGKPFERSFAHTRPQLTSELFVQHNHLIHELNSLDYAPPTLQQVREQLKGVKEQHAQDLKALNDLRACT